MIPEEAIVKVKDIMIAEIYRTPSYYDAEVEDEVYSDTYKVDEILELNKVVCEALGKQIPKKPIYSDYRYNGSSELLPYCAKCPSCGREVTYGTWNYVNAHHCECGQALD